MKKTLIGMLAAMLLISVMPVVLAGEFPQNATPGNIPPEIFLLKKTFDICNPAPSECVNYTYVSPVNYCSVEKSKTTCEAKSAFCDWVPATGGSTPYGDQDIQYAGCKDTEGEKRYNQYAFTGEQIFELVAVRDLNGAIDILTAEGTVDGLPEVKCNEVAVTLVNCDGVAGNNEMLWRGHCVDLTQIPAKGPDAGQGFEPDFDKIFECIITVEPQWYGDSVVNILAKDQVCCSSTMGIAQQWFFNPAVVLQLASNTGGPIQYESGLPGQQVYAVNKLKVTNMAEGSVDLLVFIAADDLTDPTSGAVKCCWSNVLDVEGTTCENGKTYGGMDFRCKIGTMWDQNWNDMTNKNTKEECNGVVVLDPNWVPSEPLTCYGAQGIVTEYLPILMNQHEAECEFRLQYPVPCVGSFTQGVIHVIVRAI